MKEKIAIIILFAIINSWKVFSQYLPMVQENRYWIYQSHFEEDGYPVASGFLINFEGDTLINNTVYKKVWQQGLSGTHPCPMGLMPCFVFDHPYTIFNKFLYGFIREDTIGRKVFFRPSAGLYCHVEEYPLFDFSLQVHDDLDDCKKETLGQDPGFGVIDSITYNTYWGLTRKVFHTTGWVSCIGDTYSGQVNLIESIGFEHYGLFHDPDNCLIKLYDFCEGSLSDCNIISKSKEFTEEEGISFYPNPTRTKIFISDNLALASATVINLSGQEINVACHGNTIEFNGIVSGFYILKIKTIRGEIYMAKIIKE
jgi:hypothetical protein